MFFLFLFNNVNRIYPETLVVDVSTSSVLHCCVVQKVSTVLSSTSALLHTPARLRWCRPPPCFQPPRRALSHLTLRVPSPHPRHAPLSVCLCRAVSVCSLRAFSCRTFYLQYRKLTSPLS